MGSKLRRWKRNKKGKKQARSNQLSKYEISDDEIKEMLDKQFMASWDRSSDVLHQMFYEGKLTHDEVVKRLDTISDTLQVSSDSISWIEYTRDGIELKALLWE